FGVTPDIVAIAKPIAAGLPLGAFLAKEEFASAISVGQHGTTFGGGPLACRVALEYLEGLEEEKLLENVARVGQYLREQLTSLGERSTAGREAGGRGLVVGLRRDIQARPIVEQAFGAAAAAARPAGLFLLLALRNSGSGTPRHCPCSGYAWCGLFRPAAWT